MVDPGCGRQESQVEIEGKGEVPIVILSCADSWIENAMAKHCAVACVVVPHTRQGEPMPWIRGGRQRNRTDAALNWPWRLVQRGAANGAENCSAVPKRTMSRCGQLSFQEGL
jgi:hypothetical protein